MCGSGHALIISAPASIGAAGYSTESGRHSGIIDRSALSAALAATDWRSGGGRAEALALAKHHLAEGRAVLE
ncbi:MAG: hypothetical protein VW453_06765, partial [Rhodospirillaceae bacterium]